MPCSSIITPQHNDDDDASSDFKLNESTFLASLMPKKEIAVDRFLQDHPNYDGRGVLIAIFDSGVDPAAAGLQVTSDGKPKILDVIDCSGSGDVDTSKVVKADADGCICGASGASLIINTSWKNPSGEWHIGYKFVYELFTEELTSRLKKERKRKWDEKNQEEIAKAVKQLQDFDQQHIKVEDAQLKRAREDLQNRLDLLKRQSESYDDKGPVVDAVVWHDGEIWRVALDTQSLEDDPDCGKLSNFVPLTNYRIERKYGVFSKLDACTFVVNVYNNGNVLSIVTDCSSHATHVAGIASAFHPKEPLLNGVAPGAQLISCKIGDSRLGSMETGTGLIRALIAAVEHKCDLINMSYGEPTLLPDYGRFVDLVNEVVNKHRLIFVSSAGNSGPGLSTVGAPGGTSSSIIGIGAYVSPAMAAGAHCLVEPPSEGLEYTWSSRGPTADGDLGVCVSAPGGAVAPVPTWTLQRRMLMNGTSMASPSACGGTALLISAMKAEGISVSPYTVRRALENTAVPIGDLPEDKLSTGQGLMQVDKAFEYIKKCQNFPCVRYQINIQQSGKTYPSSRGIYLREASVCRQSTEWIVQVDAKFHEDASNFEDLVPFEECIELRSTEPAVVKVPDYLLLIHNGRTFNVVVDPSNLGDGLHYYEVYGIDCKAPWRGPLFRIPITITKPHAVTSQPPRVSFSKMIFQPGHIERRYIEVPHGASWVEATMKTSGFDTARKFYVDAVQICPLQRPLSWEKVVSFPSPATKTFAFKVVSGQTLELVISQFWSSGIGSDETAIVDFEVVFHGIKVNKEEVTLDGSEGPVRIDAETLLASEELTPTAALNKIRVPYRPVDSKISALSTDRDKLPSGKQILALILTYKIKLEDGAEVKPHIPLLNGRIYDNKFESQFYVISDLNKRVYSTGDVYPSSSKLPKGEYNLQLYLRHDNVQILEKIRNLELFIEQNLEDKEIIQLSFFSQPDGPVIGNGSFKSSFLFPGIKEGFYLGPPPKDKLPKGNTFTVQVSLKLEGMEAEELCIAELFGLKGKNTKKNMKTKPKKDGNVPEDSAPANNGADAGATATAVGIDNGSGNDVGASNNATTSSGIRVSSFDYSAENFFRYIDDIAALCGEDQNTDFHHSEVQRFSSSLTFLREWRDFRYPPKSIRFGYITERCQSSEEKDAGAITLPQFSSATVPQCDVQSKEHPVDTKLQESRCRDFVMCVGGPVWALDWCPWIDERPDCSAKCEFVAVATHPPGSSYHKMGAPLTGRGVIQIWCLLNIREQDEEKCYLTNKGKKRPKKDKSTKVTRPRGRPRKNPKGKVIDNTNSETPQYIPALDVQFPESSSELPASDGVCWNNEEILPIIDMSRRGHKIIEASSEKSAQIKRPRGRPKKSSKEATVCSSNSENQAVQALAVQVPEDSAEINFSGAADGNRNEAALQQCSVAKQKQTKKAASACNNILETHVKSSRLKANHRDVGCNEDAALLTQVENDSSQPHGSSAMGNVVAPNSISGNVTMPKLVSCLAHNGKLAWDVKWQPRNMYDPVSKHRMGYLAVLLGNGSLEVWEVPLPRVLREIYKHREGTDPRFIKLAPVFKCSMLKRGGKQSIPLTVEWSVMPPHDYLLVGCHDGMVALWKFSIKTSSKCDDTKPVLCFRGDAAPIRAVAWTPFEGDPESFNIIVTAGHEGLKFWDLRNPFRPLRSMQPVPRNIYSLDWLPKPSCIIMSFEDGTMKTISLVKVANEFPVNGKTYNGKRQPWLHTYSLSSSAIWNVQVSRNTGMVAYCGADGTVFRFQLTTKAVEIGDSHHSVPFFLCGSVTEEDSTLVINSSVSTGPFPLKRSIERVRHAQSFRDLLRKSATALCGDDDLGMASESEEALSSVKQPKRQKLTGSDKKKPAESNSLVSKDDASARNLGDDTEKADFGNIPEVFPSKMVALHRVRWNMNKGSERWLCFGGAGGIVRCQEFVYTDIDRRWALKR